MPWACPMDHSIQCRRCWTWHRWRRLACWSSPMPNRRPCSTACRSVSMGFAPAARTWRRRLVSTTINSGRPVLPDRGPPGPLMSPQLKRKMRAWRPAVRQERLAREAQAVFPHAFERDAGVALHDDELAARIGAVGQLDQTLEVVGPPYAGLLGEQVDVGRVASVPV